MFLQNIRKKCDTAQYNNSGDHRLNKIYNKSMKSYMNAKKLHYITSEIEHTDTRVAVVLVGGEKVDVRFNFHCLYCKICSSFS
jgi:hypothetical protein